MKKRDAFTLLELIAVLAILGILIVLIVPRFSDITGRAKGVAAMHNAQVISDAAEMQALDLLHENKAPKTAYQNGDLDAYLKNVEAGEVTYNVQMDEDGKVIGGWVKTGSKKVSLPIRQKDAEVANNNEN